MMIRAISSVALSIAVGGLAGSISFAQPAMDEIKAEVQEYTEALSLDNGDNQATLEHRHHGKKHCKKLNLTDDQKNQARDAIFAFAKEKIAYKAEIKTAKVDYAQAVFGNDRSGAEAASGTIVTGVTKLVTAKVNLGNKLLFDIATDDQRKDAFLCLKSLKKKHHHHHRGHGHHGRRGGHEG